MIVLPIEIPYTRMDARNRFSIRRPPQFNYSGRGADSSNTWFQPTVM